MAVYSPMVCTISETFAAWLSCHWQCHNHDASCMHLRTVHLIVCSESLSYVQSITEQRLLMEEMSKGVMSGRKWAMKALQS